MREVVTSNGYRLTPVDVDPAVAKGALYAIVHRETGRVYIGITTRSAAQRWTRHFTLQSRCQKLMAAIRKHGAEAFDRYVIAHGLPASELAVAERELIQRCQSDAAHGFNLTAGGDANPMENAEALSKLRATMATPEYRERLIAAIRRTHNLPEVRARKSAAARTALNRPDVKSRQRASIRAAHARPETKARHAAGLSAGKRAVAERYNWVHADGRTFYGAQVELMEAHSAEALSQSCLSRLVRGRGAKHKGWRLAA